VNAEDVKRALPWYVAGALESDEADAVETALRDSPELQRELREWQALRSVAVAPQADEPAFRPAFAATWARVEEHERAKRGSARTASRRGMLEWLHATWFGMPSAGRWAVAAQFAVLVVLGGLLGLSLREPATFRVLSGSAVAAHRGTRLTVAFEPSASEAEVSSLLAAVGAQVVAGPTPEQLYTLELHGRADAAADAALDRLRAARGTVRFAARAGD
jgi:anti-sigma-K factor RskA